MKRFLKRVGKVVGSIYLLICAVLWGTQGLLIFHPVSTDFFNPPDSAIEYEVTVDESKGFKSRGYIVNPTLPGPVIVFFTGNAGHALGYSYSLADLEVPAVLSNYRGYGKSDGRPSEKTILGDAKITLQMVRERYPNRPIVLMGHSLGSAVALRTVDSNIAGMILISPFRSLAHVANRSLLRIIPVHFLMRHKFDTRSHLDSLPESVLVLYSNRDTAVLPKETERVLEGIPQADIVITDDHHNSILFLGKNLQTIRQWLVQNFEQ